MKGVRSSGSATIVMSFDEVSLDKEQPDTVDGRGEPDSSQFSSHYTLHETKKTGNVL